MKPLLALVLALSPVAIVAAEEKPTKGIDIDLVSENATISQGKPFTVGVKIHHHEGFHTYWKNPGVAGVPVKLEWHLPEGFSAGEIQWPYPEKTMMAIHPVHGYERDVMLLVQITPPATLATTRVGLKASASWMACADGCYPGKKELSAEVVVADEAKVDSGLTSAFAKARAELPQPLEHWKVETLSAVDAPEIRLRLTPSGEQALQPQHLYFFSYDGQVSSNPPQRIEKTTDGYEIVAERAPYGPKGKASLPGVLISATPFVKGGTAFASIDPAVKGAAAPETGRESATAAPAPKCECEE